MSVYKIILLAWFAIEVFLMIGFIGHKRGPVTPRNAVVALVFNAVLATLVVLA